MGKSREKESEGPKAAFRVKRDTIVRQISVYMQQELVKVEGVRREIRTNTQAGCRKTQKHRFCLGISGKQKHLAPFRPIPKIIGLEISALNDLRIYIHVQEFTPATLHTCNSAEPAVFKRCGRHRPLRYSHFSEAATGR